MHQVIRAIVYAKDEKEALEKATEVFERLTEGQRPFDYYKLFNEDGMGVSGKDRWGDLPPVALADSKEGKKLIKDGIEYTVGEAEKSLSRVRYALSKYSDEELLSGKELNDFDGRWLDFTYECHSIGMYEGWKVYLYDHDGSGITNYRRLHEVLDMYGKKEEHLKEGLKIWVVPADVHS